MLANILLIIILLIIIFIIDPLLALSLGLILGLSYGIIFYFTKNLLHRIGVKSVYANKKRFSLVNEAFSNLKELKLRGLEQFYIKDFSKFTEIYARKQSLATSLGVIPRFLIEALAFGGMISLIIFLLYSGEDFNKAIPFLALFAFTGYRLLPALQTVYVSFTQLRFSEAALNLLNNDLSNLSLPKVVLSPVRNMIFSKSIRLDNISFSYPNQKIPTLNNINLSIPFLNKVGIIGATGSGKTTLVDLILGLINPCKGTLSVDENIINDKNKKSWQNNIGYAPQQICLSDASIAANIAFGVDDKDIDYQAVEEVAKIACLHNFVIKKLPNGYNTIVGEKGSYLSGGERQRIGIARAFYNKPGIVVLDEATNALDKLTEQLIIENIDSLKYKKTLIIISHHLSCLKKCDTIFLLEKGELKKKGNYEEIEQFYRGLK
jgi:ABC-type bacteriocin/lantibiotic exporter with double-glycine peptidase domain